MAREKPVSRVSFNELQENTISNSLIMAKSVNYNNWLLKQFEGYIGKRVVDLGAGIGTFTELLLDKQLIISIDYLPECIKYLQDKFINQDNVVVFQADIETDRLLDIKPFGIDTVICFNVLEHIKDDVLLLKNLHSILSPKGCLLIIAPAHPIIYGSIDRNVGHYRRYTKKELVSKVTQVGFQIEKVSYMNFPAVFGWFIVNRILKRKGQSQGMILTYDKLIPLLSRFEKLIPPPFGLSLVMVGRK